MSNADAKPVAEARANLTELVNEVRLLRRVVTLTRRGHPQATLVPADLGDAIREAGGADAALALLRRSPTAG
jgi:prevent-host-death family protein